MSCVNFLLYDSHRRNSNYQRYVDVDQLDYDYHDQCFRRVGKQLAS
jgi:hypothetical protein